MELGLVGLGKMGANMAARLVEGGHRVVAYDRSAEARERAAVEGVEAVAGLDELVAALAAPRAVWVMVPAGEATDATIGALTALLAPGDTVIDGGNSRYSDSMAQGVALQAAGVDFVDVGTSGGVWGRTEGYALMIGGAAEVVGRLRPIFETLAPAADRGWGHVGPSGAGHFVKMVHNGIEYGLMQAYAEGFEIMREKRELGLDLHQISELWRHGSVVRSWLLDLCARALADDPDLSGLKGWVADSGEGRWTVQEALDLDVPAPVITLSLMARFVSRQDESFAAKLLAALRNQFGGHAVRRREETP
jgi:6-phosphogluconate dehydrogenase